MMMNLDRLKELKAFGQDILDNEKPIGWGSWQTCLFGQFMKQKLNIEIDNRMNVYNMIQEYFGITADQAHKLFGPVDNIKHALVRSVVEIAYGRKGLRFSDDAFQRMPGNTPGKAGLAVLERRLSYLDSIIEKGELAKHTSKVGYNFGWKKTQNSNLVRCA